MAANESTCRGCGKTIGWGETETGKKMPYDLDEKHTAHFSTCEKANDFRKKK
jgi:hypothetical protein